MNLYEFEIWREQLCRQMGARDMRSLYGAASSQARPAEKPIEPREFGPSCRCCGKRNMERMGYCLYRCQNTGETFQMQVVDGHISMLPLPQAEAIEALK